MSMGRWVPALMLAMTLSAAGEVKPSALFGDHAVIQAGREVPVWGRANAGEQVRVTIAGRRARAVAGADGRWMVRLKSMKAGGPFAMTIAGTNTISVQDVLVGEVWVGSGQSNMAFPVSKKVASYGGLVHEEEEIAAATYPRIRVFMAATAKAYEPDQEIQGEWKVCTPQNVPAFSAVSYLFARNLQRELKVPVGMLVVAYGASTAEAWVDRRALAADPALRPMLARFDALEAFYAAHPSATTDQIPEEARAPATLNSRPATVQPLKDPVQDQHQPTVLFNGMVHPVLPYAMRGVIWYQGESIVGGMAGVALYPHVMETLVRDWRGLWGEGDFPFYVVQLAALDNVSNNPAVREAQAKILSLPRTGMAVTIDIGDKKDVHPHNKEPLGERLATIALAETYGRKLEFSGPVYRVAKPEGSRIRVTFSHATGLVPKGGALKTFQVAGNDGVFVDADAIIDGNSVVVGSPQVAAPIAVRYAWSNYPAAANLYNGAGLPAAPFRTDSWDALGPIAGGFSSK